MVQNLRNSCVSKRICSSAPCVDEQLVHVDALIAVAATSDVSRTDETSLRTVSVRVCLASKSSSRQQQRSRCKLLLLRLAVLRTMVVQAVQPDQVSVSFVVSVVHMQAHKQLMSSYSSPPGWTPLEGQTANHVPHRDSHVAHALRRQGKGRVGLRVGGLCLYFYRRVE